MIRKTRYEDVDAVMDIIQDAKSYFKENEIPQWQNGYPDKEQIKKDIFEEGSYVYLEEKEVLGTFFVTFQKDPYYEKKKDIWLNENPYAVVHRIAVSRKQKGRGIAKEMFDYVKKLSLEKGIHEIRVDTHKNNLSMQKALEKNGFILCGNLFIADNAERIGFQKSI